jgi:hypothetical protein
VNIANLGKSARLLEMVFINQKAGFHEVNKANKATRVRKKLM